LSWLANWSACSFEISIWPSSARLKPPTPKSWDFALWIYRRILQRRRKSDFEIRSSARRCEDQLSGMIAQIISKRSGAQRFSKQGV
jgi:hypothetical protein